jgi:hypothetical protein
MRWRYVIGSLLGGILGATTQLAADFFCSAAEGHTMFETACFIEQDPKFSKRFAGHRGEARALAYQGFMLAWLLYRGQESSRSAMVGAFLLCLGMLVADSRKKKNGKPERVRVCFERLSNFCLEQNLHVDEVIESNKERLNKRWGSETW